MNDSSNAGCLKCLSDTTYAPVNAFRGSMSGLNGVDCHMPKTAKSATSLVLANGVIRGDVTSHIFGIDLSGAPSSFWALRGCAPLHSDHFVRDLDTPDAAGAVRIRDLREAAVLCVTYLQKVVRRSRLAQEGSVESGQGLLPSTTTSRNVRTRS